MPLRHGLKVEVVDADDSGVVGAEECTLNFQFFVPGAGADLDVTGEVSG